MNCQHNIPDTCICFQCEKDRKWAEDQGFDMRYWDTALKHAKAYKEDHEANLRMMKDWERVKLDW